MLRSDRQLKLIQLALLPALRTLARTGLSAPAQLEIKSATLCGQVRDDITHLEINADASLGLRTALSPVTVQNVDPHQWKGTEFSGSDAAGNAIVIDAGAVDIVEEHFGSTGGKLAARLYGWEWHIDDDPNMTVLWAARLRFSSPKVPLLLWWPAGNMEFSCDGNPVEGWRFQTPSGPVFLVSREQDWFIAFGSSVRPSRGQVNAALTAIGFVFGEDLSVGIIQSVGAESLGKGMAAWALGELGRRASQEAPALPLSVPVEGSTNNRTYSAGFVDFAERLIAFQAAHPDAPIFIAIHQYFESLSGLVEKQVLHAWIAAEAIATWATEKKLLKTITRGRIADHTRWTAWVKSQKATIESFANAGMEQQLFGRVLESDAGRQNDVQLVFRAEGIGWTSEMEDAERTVTARRMKA